MKSVLKPNQKGFTLLETVIAIGVLAVLLTGFMVVFTPAAEGIRKSINVQQADRLASSLEQELITIRDKDFDTGFEKAFEWIKSSNESGTAILVYQYRGSTSTLRDDGTPEPVAQIKNQLPGKDYIVVPMVRRNGDSEFVKDLGAVEGGVYLVKCTQLIFEGGELKAGTAGDLVDPKEGGSGVADADAYPEAVIAFAADFHLLPAKNPAYFKGSSFSEKFTNAKNPVFTRNLAVRR